jgi:hypothetical protein
MDTNTLPADLQDWAEAQVAAGRAPSVEVLAAQALATIKAQQEAIAAKLASAREEADRDGWIEGEDVLAELRAWIADDEAADAAGQ